MKLFCAFALLLFALPGLSFAGTLSFVSQGRWVQVDKIYDGDTFRTLKGEKIRLLGINTPEIAHTSSPGQVMGKKASRALRQLIAGKVVRLAFDEQRRDTYQRTLAQIYLRDGTWVNGKLVELGMAHVYTFTPNLRWAGDLMRLEKEARREKRGIWKTKRFSVLNATQIKSAHLGQFRVVRGQVGRIRKKGFAFRLDALNISIPRKYRRFFKHPPALHTGDMVIVHGVVRAASSGLYLALHSPFDLENISP